MTNVQIYQIVYSEKTKSQRDKGFIALDNTSSHRPDWYEYWPIRNFLINNFVEEDTYLGFLSPSFYIKTGLTSKEVFEFIGRHCQKDVIIFSPHINQAAFYLNVFEHGDAVHRLSPPGMVETMQLFLDRYGINIAMDRLVMDSTNTIFCNYFVAKPRFWRVWLELCENIWDIAESGHGDISKKINSLIPHTTDHVQMKVFLIERIASLILATTEEFSVASYNPFALARSYQGTTRFNDRVIGLDALKCAFRLTGNWEYINRFETVRRKFVNHHNMPLVGTSSDGQEFVLRQSMPRGANVYANKSHYKISISWNITT